MAKCFYHPRVDAVGICIRCQRYYCKEDLILENKIEVCMLCHLEGRILPDKVLQAIATIGLLSLVLLAFGPAMTIIGAVVSGCCLLLVLYFASMNRRRRTEIKTMWTAIEYFNQLKAPHLPE